MRKFWQRGSLVALVFILLFSLAACSGGTTSTSSGKEKEKEKEKEKVELAQGVTDDTVKIGTIGVQSGTLAFIGTPYFEGMEAYLKKVNDEGGVNGRKIELLKKDDEFKPDKAVQAMEELVYDDEVFAIVGQLGTPGVMATESIVKDEGIPAVYFGSGAKQLTKSGENFFPVQPNYFYEGKLKAKYAVEKFNAKNVVVIYQNDDTGRDGLEGFQDGLKALGKEDILKNEGKLAVSAADTDFTVPVQKAKALNPDVVIVYALAGATTGILKEFEKVNFNVPMITTYSNADASFLALAAPGAPNVIKNLYVMGWVEADEAKLKPLMDAMAKYFPNQKVINAYTMAGWVAAETFVAGLKAAGDNLSWEGYVEAMNGMTFTDGLAPEISYKDGKREGVTKMALSKVDQDANGSFIFKLETEYMEFE
ncbi:ABC transporter substrate-binding protein [Bacillus sp. FJAT-27225]|uniref:ABC transporter substrate-binding protein n=1 Tax=Bacillus sp. FJAT-27225 TaxID=1743144 RepID=UPI00080C2568|nr:ABC transporter substrate-binding protein [Bacillus sp. FJAT-27225]OCA87958.1 ABC transporter substrate-binding protein [Bacillus sp. FJAT-27225]